MTGRGRGRPRSEEAQRAILAAAYESLLRDGFANCTVDGIAADAGVSKATIYRWWPRKSVLVLDSVVESIRSVVTFDDTGDVRADIERELRRVIDFYTNGRAGRAVLEIVGASSLDPALATDLVDRLIEPTSATARQRLEKGVREGQLPPGTDADLLVHLIWGAVYHCLLVAHRSIEPDFAASVIDAVLPPARRAASRSRARAAR